MIETESTGLLTLYSDVRAAAVHWLWYPFIASGKITLLQGDPGDGKSTMMMRLIAELSTGGVTPDGCPCAGFGNQTDGRLCNVWNAHKAEFMSRGGV